MTRIRHEMAGWWTIADAAVSGTASSDCIVETKNAAADDEVIP